MSDHGGDRIPEPFRTGLEVPFDLIRVQFDESWQQIVLRKILAGRAVEQRMRIRRDLGDPPVLDAHGSVHHFLLEHDAGVGQGV